ncbi:kelch repeat-containing F-box family protein [Arabidopsis lyrata subsp. lyrata]|uniref:Kelch repeat-containing F-box family protein n=1 Tax=Arabidopsis lyrata subsp. lyrata TaxID=81972 RepID=D7KI31_ARALL|nr:kelch repeat-containing F-box family protein [Arabidopsis lyrata subsp. lyrata]
MVNISEILDDSNDGGNPNKKPEEQVLRRSSRISTRNENQNKKPKEEEKEDIRSISFPIPDDLTEACIALIRRCDYPSLSSVSSYFFTLIASSRLYETRSRLGLSETFLYAAIKFPDDIPPKWYILHRNKVSSLRLTELSSLPPMYVIGGVIDRRRLQSMNLIDCRTHKCRSLPKMKRGRYNAAAGVIDGKIFKQSWESLPGPYPKTSSGCEWKTYVVMEEKLYILDSKFCLVYEPKRNIEWDASVGATPLMDLWKYTCSYSWTSNSIVVYDPKDKTWRPVKGESLGRLPSYLFDKSEMANFGGKLVILGSNESYVTGDCIGEKGIWCVMIALEKREGEEIWGMVESLDCVLGDINFLMVRLCRTVTI